MVLKDAHQCQNSGKIHKKLTDTVNREKLEAE
jgi:hypothetical protein